MSLIDDPLTDDEECFYEAKMMTEAAEGDCFADLVRQTQAQYDDDNDTTSETEWRSARLSSSDSTSISFNDSLRVQQLEEEQERLNNSLFSLSSHFAQVQFRLKQIAEADGDAKESLLKDLQDFAFKGVADMDELQRLRRESTNGEILEKQKERQNELLKRLREQLEDLEKIAYENGEGNMPSTLILQKQKAVLDKLNEKIQLNLDIDKMSQQDLHKEVEDAIHQLVNPFKEKEQLVEQLQTQIVDLERFVSYLQAENGSSEGSTPVKALSSSQFNNAKPKTNGAFFGLVGCSTSRFQKNQLKQTSKGNHYGDERAHLQLAVDATLQVLQKYTLLNFDTNKSIDEEKEVEVMNDEVFERSEEEVVSVVRKQLCPALKALLEHGMMSETVVPMTIPGLGCFMRKPTANSNKPKRLEHIWDVILFLYEAKQGKELSEAPVRRLSQSFKLENVAGKSITSMQVLLTTIENIVSSHCRLRRSKDAQWKAFVSAALNEKKLPAWIRIIFRTRAVVETCYNAWSYVARTGCEELYELLEGLHKYNIEMPVDLALRPFQQMKDAF